MPQLANRAILKAPQAGEQHIHQVVLKPVNLVRDEGGDVQIPVGVIPARELENLRAERPRTGESACTSSSN